MDSTTIKMGKRGTLVLPAKLRKQFGLEDGTANLDCSRFAIPHTRAAAAQMSLF